MTDDRTRTPRTLLIADHLWDAFAAMAADMGTDRDGLVNQALYTFARLNGFLLPADLHRVVTPDPRGHATPPPSAGVGRQTSLAPAANGRESIEVDRSLLRHEVGAPTAMELPDVTPNPAPSKVLVLLADGRELDRVRKDRFLIGRGKHCDLIIHSGKVSREHAAIVRRGTDYFIEDLGSSNGTWFDKRRINRRQIQDGDEYYICAEKLSCAFR